MISLGEQLWEQFKIEVCEIPNLDSLVDACCMIEPRTSTSLDVSRGFDGDKWLTAIHAVYRSNFIDVKRYLSQIASDINPDVGFLTTFDSESGRGLVDRVKPFDTKDCQIYSTWREPHIITGIARRVTQWRQELRDQISDPILQRPIGNSTVGYYLSSPVTWEWHREASLIYDRSVTPQTVDDVDDLPF